MQTYYAETLFELVKKTIPDGVYLYHCTTNNIEIEFQIINYNTDITLNSSATVGNAVADTQMLILKFNRDLTINSGVTLTPQVRKKGMVIFVSGVLTNNGVITMTARGASAVGQDVYLYEKEYVPAKGANGGARVQKGGDGGLASGIAGSNGTNRKTGGGASGGALRGASYKTTIYSGAGGTGTSYSGGSGGGGISAREANWTGYDASPAGGAGGAGRTNFKIDGYGAGGGAGNPGGIGSLEEKTYTDYSGKSGTGGLLIIYSNKLINNDRILSNGSTGGYANSRVSASGGSSGGGSINIFTATKIENKGTITATGGSAVGNGGAKGGNGSVTIMENLNMSIMKTLIYDTIINALSTKGITTYTIDKDDSKGEDTPNDFNFVTIDDEIIVTNDEYIFVAKEEDEVEQQSLETTESTNMKSILKSAIVQTLADKGLIS